MRGFRRTMFVIAIVSALFPASSLGSEKRSDDRTHAIARKVISSLSEKEQDVLETAFRHLLIENGKRIDYKNKPFYLVAAAGDQDLDMTDDFLKRLADMKCTIRKGTHWKQNAGTRLTVRIGQKISDTEVELDLKMYRHYLESFQYTCRFYLENGKWQIKKGSERHFLQS